MTVMTRFEQLGHARGVIADAAHHDDAALLKACHTVIRLTTDAREATRARDLKHLIQGEAA